MESRSVLKWYGLLVVLGLLLIGMMMHHWINLRHTQATALLQGTWTEQGVARYSMNTLTVSEHGIHWNQKRISTHYSFDGETLSFDLGGTEQRFYLDKNRNRLLHLTAPYKAQYTKQ